MRRPKGHGPPIVLLIAVAAVDLLDAPFTRPAWLSTSATSLSVVGAAALVAAHLTGAEANATVFMRGMAHPLVSGARVSYR